MRLICRLDIPLDAWPSNSPDRNPIVNLDRATANRKCTSKQELFEVLSTAWKSIPVEFLASLVHSMPERLNAVIDNKGYPINYLVNISFRKSSTTPHATFLKDEF